MNRIDATSDREAACMLAFPQLGRRISVHPGETVFQTARRHGVRIVGACGGRGTCGSCMVRVLEGNVEGGGAGLGGSSKQWIRACRVAARSDCTLEVAPRSLAPVARTGVDADLDDCAQTSDPVVVARELRLEAATLVDNASDVERIERALGEPLESVDIAVARQLPGLLRSSAWALGVRVRRGELIGVAPAGRAPLGLAIDLGTTNAAGFLVDLGTGRTLAALGIENPQVAWGADLVSRIEQAARTQALAHELREAALRAIQSLADDLSRAVGASSADVVEVAVCANTAMHHLLLGLPVAQLGRAPFVSALREAVDVKARELGLAISPGAYVHLVANVGGFVGGDHVSALLATERRWGTGASTLVMDIGTNTEISLVHDGAIHSISCPSGPALEGGQISCGMRAADGAIERVRAVDGRLEIDVIGGKEPVGVCGSGVLDALAAMRRARMIDGRGRLAGGHADVRDEAGRRAARLAPEVWFTQDDVRAVQLAKAAIRAGTELLLGLVGLRENDVERIVIAGSFGAYIDVRSATAIGLLPPLARDRFEQVGNAAGVGVRRLLVSSAARVHAADLARQCRYVELSSISGFQKTFMKHIGFDPIP